YMSESYLKFAYANPKTRVDLKCYLALLRLDR
ncbi:MAG: hypothetical protein ACI8SJ_002776, partial [Shewanella sp.]